MLYDHDAIETGPASVPTPKVAKLGSWQKIRCATFGPVSSRQAVLLITGPKWALRGESAQFGRKSPAGECHRG